MWDRRKNSKKEEEEITTYDKEKENEYIKYKLREEEEKIQEMLELILPIYNKELPKKVQDAAFFDSLLKDFTNGEGKTNWDEPDPPVDIQTAIENFNNGIGALAEAKDKIIED